MNESPLPIAARFEVAAFGELFAEPSRVAMLFALMDGRARPASELAAVADVTRATASAHLARLVAGGLLAMEAAGRHRYYRLAGERVADAVEALALLHPAGRAGLRATLSPAQAAASSSASHVAPAIAEARTCYRHLAGRLGVGFLRALERQRWLKLREGAPALTRRGEAAFGELGLAPHKWPAGKLCLDWTERRHHLGGELGGLLTAHLLELNWLQRLPATRALRVTAKGERELHARLALR